MNKAILMKLYTVAVYNLGKSMEKDKTLFELFQGR